MRNTVVIYSNVYKVYVYALVYFVQVMQNLQPDLISFYFSNTPGLIYYWSTLCANLVEEGLIS
jgi:hypothetical protein